MEVWWRAIALAAALLPVGAQAGPGLVLLPISCDPDRGAAATDGYHDSTGDLWVGDAFPDCKSPDFWNGVGSRDDEEPFTWDERGGVTSDGSSVTALVSTELGVPEGASASLSVFAEGHGLFRAPPGTSFAPARLVFEVERAGASLDPVGGLVGSVTGPGVSLSPRFGDLPDGVHTFDALLESDATYEVSLAASGLLEGPGYRSARITFYVLAPEPAGLFLVLAGAVVLGGSAPRARIRGERAPRDRERPSV